MCRLRLCFVWFGLFTTNLDQALTQLQLETPPEKQISAPPVSISQSMQQRLQPIHTSSIYGYVWLTSLFSCLIFQYITAVQLIQEQAFWAKHIFSFFLILLPMLLLYSLDRLYYLILRWHLTPSFKQYTRGLSVVQKAGPWIFWGIGWAALVNSFLQGYQLYRIRNILLLGGMLYFSALLLFSHLAHFFVDTPPHFDRLSWGYAPPPTTPASNQPATLSLSPSVRKQYLIHQRLFGHLYQGVLQLKLIIQLVVMAILEMEAGYLTPGWTFLYAIPDGAYAGIIFLDLLSRWHYQKQLTCNQVVLIKILHSLIALCAGSLFVWIAPSTRSLPKKDPLPHKNIFYAALISSLLSLCTLFSLGFKRWQRRSLDYQLMQLMEKHRGERQLPPPNRVVSSSETTTGHTRYIV